MRWMVMLTALAAAPPAAAQDGFDLGGDVFRAGRTAVFDAAGANDAFLAGEQVRLGAEVAGSAHLAGRRVELAGPVGGDLYAAGMDIVVGAPVAGDATLAARDIAVTAEIGEELRAMGATVRVAAPVGGAALLSGDTVVLDAPVSGDVALMGERLEFGEAAAIEGRLILYGDEESLAAVPARVVPPERIDLRTPEDWEGSGMGMSAPSAATAVGSFIVGVLILALLAWLAALVAPVGVEVLRDRTGARPFKTLGVGFLALSALIGAAVVLALTIIGIFVAPAVLLVAGLLGLAGYVVAVYMIGSSLWEAMRRGEPDSAAERALAAVIGAAVASLLVLVPFLGWLFMLAAVLIGMGALAGAIFSRPSPA